MVTQETLHLTFPRAGNWTDVDNKENHQEVVVPREDSMAVKPKQELQAFKKPLCQLQCDDDNAVFPESFGEGGDASLVDNFANINLEKSDELDDFEIRLSELYDLHDMDIVELLGDGLSWLDDTEVQADTAKENEGAPPSRPLTRAAVRALSGEAIELESMPTPYPGGQSYNDFLKCFVPTMPVTRGAICAATTNVTVLKAQLVEKEAGTKSISFASEVREAADLDELEAKEAADHDKREAH